MNDLERAIADGAAEFARTRMRHTHSSHGWDHVVRVVKTAERIAASEVAADPFIVAVAAVMHDIARGEEDRSNGTVCHAEAGSEMARRFLLQRGLDPARADHIADCILTHRFRNHHAPATIEAKILFDADKLDSIGAIGVGRAFLFSGEIGARLHNDNSMVHGTDAYSEEDTAYREYMVKLRLVKETLLTVEGRRIAAGRHAFMEEFFSRLRGEIEGND
ncbi:MAG: HD domain-containing protein [Spirochaetes bacterium]|nr:HD domain-containing protein [Spirochaetota bacterium]